MQLSEHHKNVIQKHIESSGLQNKKRIKQWDGAYSVYCAASGRLWVHNDHPKKQTLQELYFYSASGVVGTLTTCHPIKLWDLQRELCPRELARLQGFPEHMKLPSRKIVRLFGNAVAVPCAAYAISRVCHASDSISHLDVCAGVGGFSFALKTVCPKANTVGFSEICKSAVHCFKENFPNCRELGDAKLVESWPKCDLLTAGFPCQPFSCNARQRARNKNPSKDFYKIVLHALKQSNASKFVLENVKTFLSIGKESYLDLLTELQNLGFSVESCVLNSVDFGLPQERKRLYIVGQKNVPPLAFLPIPHIEKRQIHDILSTSLHVPN